MPSFKEFSKKFSPLHRGPHGDGAADTPEAVPEAGQPAVRPDAARSREGRARKA